MGHGAGAILPQRALHLNRGTSRSRATGGPAFSHDSMTPHVPTGLVGLGRGKMSLVSQLNVSQFSYCLTDIAFYSVSTLTLGGGGGTSANKTARLLDSPQKLPYSSFYYVNVTGISVGAALLNLSKEVFQRDGEGRGGMIIDSRTALTYLPQIAFDAILEEAGKQLNVSVELVYTLQLSIHFDNNATLTVPSQNWLLVDYVAHKTFLLLDTISSDSSVPGILGNILQQNIMVTYDLAHSALSFEPKHCG
ncbi:unnamed protein product [Cuscuta epithymum]|uniref:Peptidase A1 domain-containing protein n=1 Tax=Cuscuta epithymum TaxID=186058 RepID=A0AAV0DJZ6_9ASTE|nr:unnamed protein product [Cuscuta epithymum]